MERKNNYQLETRAGLRPSMKELPYTIDTDAVENHLQQRFNSVAKMIAKQTNSTPKDIKIQVYTTEAGKKFLPFILVMPEDVLVDNKEYSDIADIFNPKDSDGTARIREEFKRLINIYTYNKYDIKAFYSDSWRHDMGVTRTTSNTLSHTVKPRLIQFNHGRVRNVVVMIDPIRVFHDMLTINGNSDDFHVDVYNIRKLGDGRYRYEVKRSAVKNNKNYKKTFINELNARIRGGN